MYHECREHIQNFNKFCSNLENCFDNIHLRTWSNQEIQQFPCSKRYSGRTLVDNNNWLMRDLTMFDENLEFMRKGR